MALSENQIWNLNFHDRLRNWINNDSKGLNERFKNLFKYEFFNSSFYFINFTIGKIFSGKFQTDWQKSLSLLFFIIKLFMCARVFFVIF